MALRAALKMVAAESVHALQHSRRPRPHLGIDVVGLLANRLRQLFCAPGTGRLHQPTEMQKWLPAFAALTPCPRGATLQDYKSWLARVAQNEFADEIIMAAVAQHLRLWIVVVPYTPSTAPREWTITEYPDSTTRGLLGIDGRRKVYLGNNDVHYVWLRRE